MESWSGFVDDLRIVAVLASSLAGIAFLLGFLAVQGWRHRRRSQKSLRVRERTVREFVAHHDFSAFEPALVQRTAPESSEP